MGTAHVHPERDNSLVFEDYEEELDMYEVFVSGYHLRLGDKAIFLGGQRDRRQPQLSEQLSPCIGAEFEEIELGLLERRRHPIAAKDS